MMKSDRTSTQLRHVYPNKDDVYRRLFDPSSSSHTYGIVRAAAVLSGEEHSVPDALALLSRIACANRVFRQMNYNVYQENVTPAVGRDELKSTPYIIPRDIEITNASCRIDYGITRLYTPALKKRVKQNGFDEDTRQLFHDNLYGEIFDESQLSKDGPWMFDVPNTIKEAIECGVHMCISTQCAKVCAEACFAIHPSQFKCDLKNRGIFRSGIRKFVRLRKLFRDWVFAIRMEPSFFNGANCW